MKAPFEVLLGILIACGITFVAIMLTAPLGYLARHIGPYIDLWFQYWR